MSEKVRLTKPMTAYSTEWPAGTVISNFRLDDKYRYCGHLPDGHFVTNILPDFIEEIETEKGEV